MDFLADPIFDFSWYCFWIPNWETGYKLFLLRNSREQKHSKNLSNQNIVCFPSKNMNSEITKRLLTTSSVTAQNGKAAKVQGRPSR